MEPRGSEPIHIPLRGIAGTLLLVLGMIAGGDAMGSHPPGDSYGSIPFPSAAVSARAELEGMLGRGLHQAVLGGDVREVSSLLALRPELLESRDARGFTPLHVAVLANRQDMIRFLVVKGANVDARSDGGKGSGVTPLHLATLRGMEETVEYLLAGGADANPRDGNGVTPLHISAYIGNAGIAELLMARCADVNARENEGHTPLHIASGRGSREVAWMLLRHGADATALDLYGRTARSIAVAKQDREIDGMIRWAASEVAASGASPLGPACRPGG